MLVFERVVVDATNDDLATGRLFLARQKFEQRGLARPARPHEDDKLARANVHADTIERWFCAIFAITFRNPI